MREDYRGQTCYDAILHPHPRTPLLAIEETFTQTISEGYIRVPNRVKRNFLWVQPKSKINAMD